MWDLLKKADIEQAKQELRLRRTAALRRHAEESQNLDADRVEAETLNCLIDLFVKKLAKPPKMPEAPGPAPISTQKIGAKTPSEGRHQHHRDQHPGGTRTIIIYTWFVNTLKERIISEFS